MPSQSKLLGDLISAAGTVTVNGSSLLANTIANSAFQTGSVENYFNTQGLSIGRNRIINGAMEIDQRNAGASVSIQTSTGYILDRWTAVTNQNSKYSVQQDAGAVTPPVGFNDYLGVTSSSAYTVGSSDYMFLAQYIEGYNVADLDFGKSTAKTITISFWVRSSLTGTFGGVIGNGDQNRTYPFSYTISSANTWEQKTITIAGDTTGTWNVTNGVGLAIRFGLGVGSTYLGTAGSWSSSQLFSVTGATNVVATNGATFYLTGVQLEVGTSATPFERRMYGQEFALCQRYYWASSDARMSGYQGASNDLNQQVITFPVAMRSGPSIFVSTASYPADNNITSISAQNITTTTFVVTTNKNTGGGYFFSRFTIVGANEL